MNVSTTEEKIAKIKEKIEGIEEKKTRIATFIQILVDWFGDGVVSRAHPFIGVKSKAKVYRWLRRECDITNDSVIEIANALNLAKKDIDSFLDGQLPLIQILRAIDPEVLILLKNPSPQLEILLKDPVIGLDVEKSLPSASLINASRLTMQELVDCLSELSAEFQSRINKESQKSLKETFNPSKLNEIIDSTLQIKKISLAELINSVSANPKKISDLMKGLAPAGRKEKIKLLSFLAPALIKSKTPQGSMIPFDSGEELLVFCTEAIAVDSIIAPEQSLSSASHRCR